MLINLLAAFTAAALPPDTAHAAQGVDYRIEARLDESTDLLHGRAELTYTNNAAAPLDTLWLHQHLNAFRPNSDWARREAGYDQRRFQDLGPDDHAYDRLLQVEIDGRTITPVYPGAPDSTVVGLPLATPLGPGSTAVVRFDWEARLATEPRRQGRQGRHYDFAQWYPRIAAYTDEGWQTQPLMPQGEFFGEFGRYDVTLEVATDQVVGATGVPVEGDPGWSTSARAGYEPVSLQSDAYAAAPAHSLGLLSATPAAGHRQIRWRADDVHHFAWSANPDFVYEGGSLTRSGPQGGTIAVHVLYWPEDEDWADGVVLERSITALEWLQEMFGPYPWPQFTNLHRIESGGTEFPMLVMNGSPSEGLIVHEATHQYLHGILANNEFREGWLDEGFTSFMTNWYFEEQGNPAVWDRAMENMRQLEQRGMTQPIALAGADFDNPPIYSAMTYTKPDLVLRMLRWMIGEDSMRQVLRTYYDRHAMEHVTEAELRRVVNDVTGTNYDWFFDQWIHTTGQLDYAVRDARATQEADGSWVTRITIGREGDAWMPVTLRVGDAERRLEFRERERTIEMRSSQLPTEVVLDPENVLLDIDASNNRMEVVVP